MPRSTTLTSMRTSPGGSIRFGSGRCARCRGSPWSRDFRSTTTSVPSASWRNPSAPESIAGFALHWLIAAIAYTGEAVAFYGLLPLGITFVLFVLFLPWAIPWAQGGDYED